jgi:CDP-glycerol glycerophosphotransferase (TagB/SpsB family)
MYIATSLGLDASVFNKPQIIVSFDGWEKKPYVQSVERYNQEDCLANIVRRNGTRVVRSEEEWIRAIQGYLIDPMADNEGRQKAIRDFLFSSDGKASARIAQVLLHHLTS